MNNAPTISTRPSLLARLKGEVLRKLFSNTLATGFNFVSKWLFNFALSKFLSTSTFGVFSLLWSMANLCMNFCSFGANLHLIYGVSKEKERKYDFLVKSVWISLIIAAAVAVIWGALYVLRLEIQYLEYMGWAILLGFIMSLTAILFAFFKGMGEFDKEAKGFFLFFVLVVAALGGFWMWGTSDSVVVNLVILAGFSMLVLAYAIRRLRKQMTRDGAQLRQVSLRADLRKYWREKVPYGLHEVQGALYTHINIILLGFLVLDSDLGTFRSIQLLIVPVSILPSIFSQVQLNHLTKKLNDPADFKRAFRRFLLVTSGIGIAIFALYMLVGETVIHWVYNNKFESGLTWILIICFTLTFLFKFISSNYGVLITSAGNQKVRVYVTFLSIVISVVLTLWLANYYGIVGAAIAMAAAYFIIMLCYAAYGELVILKNMRRDVDSSIRS